MSPCVLRMETESKLISMQYVEFFELFKTKQKHIVKVFWSKLCPVL